MRPTLLRPVLPALLVLVPLTACRTPAPTASPACSGAQASRPVPASSGSIAWKERMAQAYVYAEARGDYRDLPPVLAATRERLRAAGVSSAGSPFLLLYDDPGRVPVAELRSRLCVPVAARPDGLPAGLRFDVLPTALVVFREVHGEEPGRTTAVPELLRRIETLAGARSGPVREIALEPRAGSAPVRTEVQVPWTRPGGA